MTTDWKRKLWQIIVTIGKGIWFFIRMVFVPFVMVIGRFILFTITPAIWKFMREKVYPALHRIYMLLPWRRTITASVLGIIVIGVAFLVIDQSRSTSDRLGADKPIQLPEKEGKWVKNLISGSWAEQKSATKSILQQLGVTVLDDDALPADDDTMFVIPPELTLLAQDGGQKETMGRLTLAELAHLMNDLDFPFIADQDPVILLQNGVRNWVKAALKKPKQDGAEAPLFLYAMAAQQEPAIDLSSDHWVADDYYLTYLELYVFVASFFQALPKEPIQGLGGTPNLFVNKAHAAEVGACSYAKDYYNTLGKKNGVGDLTQFDTDLVQLLANELTGLGLKSLGKMGQAAGKLMVPLSIILKIQKLAMLYGSLDMSISTDSRIVHKAASSEPRPKVTFTAKVGVDEEKYKEYLEQWNSSQLAKDIKDCLSFMGIPMPTDMSDIALEVDKWAVSWTLIGNHATWGTDLNKFDNVPQRRMNLKRVSKTHGQASFVIEVNREEGQHEGDVETGYIWAKASLNSDQPPVLGTLVEAGKSGADAVESGGWGLMEILGLGNAAIDVIGGWLQRIIDPEKYYKLAVDYHVHRFPDYTYAGTVTASNSAYEGGTDMYYIGAAGSIPMTYSTHQSNSYSASLEPTRISITPGRNEAYWKLGGEARMTSTYSHRIDASGSIGCIGGSNQITIRHSGSGSNTNSIDAEGLITRLGNEKEGYQFALNFSPATTYIIYESKKNRIESPGGCEHVAPSVQTETFTQTQQGSISTLKEDFILNEAYPEIISGSKEVEESDGTITNWKWHFQRRDPSDNPTYIDAVGG